MNENQQKQGFFQQVTSWVATPFQTNGSALRWILFVGLLIVAVWFWKVILIDLSREASSIEA